MNPIAQAMVAGYTLPQILKFLTNAFPKLAPKIDQAQKSGYSLEKIINFVMKTMGGEGSLSEGRPFMSQQQIHGQRMAEQGTATQQLAGMAAKAVAVPAGAYALSRALPSAVQQLAPGLMQSPVGAPQSQAALQPTGAISPQVPTEANLPQESPFMNKSEFLWNHLVKRNFNLPDIADAGMLRVANSIRNKGGLETKEEFDKFVQDYEQHKEEYDKLPDLLRYLNHKYNVGYGQKASQQGQEQPTIQPASEELVPSEQRQEMSQEKRLVGLPSGELGTIESAERGAAKVRVGDKTSSIEEDKLIESPLPEKDLAELYDDLISGIEKKEGEEVSKNVYWAGYDPKTNELVYIPHNGRAYVYGDIDAAMAEELTSYMHLRKTTGENYIGAWTAGTKSPMGSAMSKLIQKLQKERGGKGLEYKSRFETVYDALEPAKQAAKKKYEKAKKPKKAKKPRVD